MLKKLFQGFYFVKNIFNRSKIFFEENPKRIKLLGVLVIFLALLLTIISALTIQNFTQRASGGDFTFEITRGPGSYKILTEKEESKLSNTVYILIRNLPSGWFLLSNQSNNTLGVQAYATNQIDCYGTPCNLGDRCEKVNEGDGTFSGICFSNPVNTPTPTLNINNPIISFTPTPTPIPPPCGSLNQPCCGGSGGNCNAGLVCNASDGYCDAAPTPTPTPTKTPTPTPTRTPTPTPTIDPYKKIILHEIRIENADTDGGSGGSSPSTYIYDNPNQTNQTLPIGSTWTLNRLLSGQIKAIRTVRITLFGAKGEQISATASIMLVRSLSTPTPIPTLIPSPTPTKSPSEIKTGGPQFTSILEKCSSIGAFVYAGIVHGKAIGGGKSTATVCCPTDTPFFCGSEQYACVASKIDCSQLLLTPTPTRIITQAPILVGDLNGDGKVNDIDTKILLSQYGQKGANLSGDLFKDNVVDEFDYNKIIRSYTPNLWFGEEQQP